MLVKILKIAESDSGISYHWASTLDGRRIQGEAKKISGGGNAKAGGMAWISNPQSDEIIIPFSWP